MKEKEYRYDDLGRILLMTRAEGYVMVRRPYAIPFVKSEKWWASLSEKPLPDED